MLTSLAIDLTDREDIFDPGGARESGRPAVAAVAPAGPAPTSASTPNNSSKQRLRGTPLRKDHLARRFGLGATRNHRYRDWSGHGSGTTVKRTPPSSARRRGSAARDGMRQTKFAIAFQGRHRDIYVFSQQRAGEAFNIEGGCVTLSCDIERKA